jgi:hypothetical protein
LTADVTDVAAINLPNVMSLGKVKNFEIKFVSKYLPFIIYTSTFQTKPTVPFQYADYFNNISKMVPIWSSNKRTSNGTLNIAV